MKQPEKRIAFEGDPKDCRFPEAFEPSYNFDQLADRGELLALQYKQDAGIKEAVHLIGTFA